MVGHTVRRSLAVVLALAAVSLSSAGFAAGMLASVAGDVRVFLPEAKKPVAGRKDLRVGSGTTLVTGADGLAVLRFDDEQAIVLAPNSELTIIDSSFLPGAAAADRAEFLLHRGALRTVTGLIARRNTEMFVIRTPHVNLGVRGTDFSLTIIGQSYWSVNEGAVVASTNVGKGVFGKGADGRSSALDRLASGLSSAGLPVAVLALFNELNSPKVAAQLGPAPGGAAMAGAAPAAGSEATSAGIGAGSMMALLGAVAAALAAAGGGGGDSGGGSATQH